jgi:hypothetical protein
MGYANGPKIITDNLVLYADPGNLKSYPGSGTSVYDLTTYQSNFSLENGAQINNGSFIFDGTNDFTTTTPGQVFYQYTTNLTACAWFRRNGTITGGSGGGQSTQNVDNWSTHPATNVWLFHGNPGNTITFYVNAVNDSSYYSRGISTPVLNDNTWYFICGTCSASSTKIYVNGIQTGMTTGINVGSIVNNSNSVVQYGKDPRFASDRFFNGSVGVNYLYNRELSSVEILQNYINSKGRFGL